MSPSSEPLPIGLGLLWCLSILKVVGIVALSLYLFTKLFDKPTVISARHILDDVSSAVISKRTCKRLIEFIGPPSPVHYARTVESLFSGTFAFSSGDLPAKRIFMILLSISNQNGAPMETASTVRSHPNGVSQLQLTLHPLCHPISWPRRSRSLSDN